MTVFPEKQVVGYAEAGGSMQEDISPSPTLWGPLLRASFGTVTGSQRYRGKESGSQRRELG